MPATTTTTNVVVVVVDREHSKLSVLGESTLGTVYIVHGCPGSRYIFHGTRLNVHSGRGRIGLPGRVPREAMESNE